MQRFVRVKEIALLMGRSTSAVYRMIEVGMFPRPMKLGPKRMISAWLENEVQTIMQAEMQGISNDDMRELATELVEQRKQSGAVT